MDASRDLSNDAATQDLAWRSALRNNVDHTKPGYTVTATRGTVSNGVFTATGSNPTAVQVRVTTPYHDFFGGSSATLSASAVASNSGLAQFALGATLVDINTGLLSFGANLALVGYNGLVAGTVTLGALATQLGLSALTPDQILASQVSVGQLATASSNLLAASDPGASANLSALGATLLSQAYNNNNKIPLGDALEVYVRAARTRSATDRGARARGGQAKLAARACNEICRASLRSPARRHSEAAR